MTVDLEPVAPVVSLDAMKALAEPLRLRIVQMLAEEELCVCHLVDELAIAQPLVSHHLRVLRDAGIVESSRFRYWTYYRLRSASLATAGEALARLAEAAEGAGDRRRPCC